MEACAVICRKATVALPDANFPTSRAQNRGFCAFLAFGTPVFGRFEHKIGVFVRFWGLEPLFLGFSSTKSRFLCSFTKLDVGFGHFPAERGIAAPAEPLHLRSRCTCAADTTAAYRRCTCVAAVPSAVACSRLRPVPPVLPLLPPLHLRSRRICADDTTAAYPRRTCRRVRVMVSFRLGRRS